MKKSRILIIMAVMILVVFAFSVVISLFFPSKTVPVPNFDFKNKNSSGFWVLQEYIKRCKITVIEDKSFSTSENSLIFINAQSNQSPDNIIDSTILDALERGNTIFMLNTEALDFKDTKCALDYLGTEKTPVVSVELSQGMSSFLKETNFSAFQYLPPEFTADLYVEDQFENQAVLLPLILSKNKGNGRLYYCATGIFTNAMMEDPEYAVLIRNLFVKHNATTAFLISKTLKTPSEENNQTAPLGVLVHKNVIITFFHIILAVLLLVIYYAIRFGNPVSLQRFYKRKITEHLEAVGGFWKQRGAASLCETIMVRYFNQITESLKGRLDHEEEIKHKGLSMEKPGLSPKDILVRNMERQNFLDKNLNRRINHE